LSGSVCIRTLQQLCNCVIKVVSQRQQSHKMFAIPDRDMHTTTTVAITIRQLIGLFQQASDGVMLDLTVFQHGREQLEALDGHCDGVIVGVWSVIRGGQDRLLLR